MRLDARLQEAAQGSSGMETEGSSSSQSTEKSVQGDA